MKSIAITLPDELEQYVNEQVSEGGYGSVSEYMQALILADQQQSDDELEELLSAGLEGPATPLTREDWSEIRERSTALRRR